MEFKFVSAVYVEPVDLREMKRLVRMEGMSAEQAFETVASGWDDEDYFLAPYIEDDVISFIMQDDWS